MVAAVGNRLLIKPAGIGLGDSKFVHKVILEQSLQPFSITHWA